ncbi:hypothetical protein [Chlorobium ferrooxidans]|uniref:hypothetical protein n=1 Tax=Chlorobium ferrooxidans TaxID=84205 RepID=UPI0012EAC120|nr:hypothetical protein [Chlorobium ferrooxidans]
MIFEHELFSRITTRNVQDPNDSTKMTRESKIPGLKASISLFASYYICYYYSFDVMHVVLRGTPYIIANAAGLVVRNNADPIGILLTSLIVAGGSAGAILIFQGYLNLSKEGRDARS